jgi:predicted SAM-dependent methyltransferase
MPSVNAVLSEWKRVLTKGGRLVIECPDLKRAASDYIAGNQERLFSIYGRQRFPGDAHHWGYDSATLPNLLRDLGFVDIEVLEAQDGHSKFEPCIRVECSKQ